MTNRAPVSTHLCENDHGVIITRTLGSSTRCFLPTKMSLWTISASLTVGDTAHVSTIIRSSGGITSLPNVVALKNWLPFILFLKSTIFDAGYNGLFQLFQTNIADTQYSRNTPQLLRHIVIIFPPNVANSWLSCFLLTRSCVPTQNIANLTKGFFVFLSLSKQMPREYLQLDH